VINCLAIRGPDQVGRPVTVVSSDGKSVFCATRPQDAETRPELAIQRVQHNDDLPRPAPRPRATLPSGLSQVPVIQPPSPRRVAPPAAPLVTPPAPPVQVTSAPIPVTPPAPSVTPAAALATTLPTSAPCGCAQGEMVAHERPTMLDKLMAWKHARAARKQPPAIVYSEVVTPAPQPRAPIGEHVITVQPAKYAKPAKPRLHEAAPVSAPRYVPAATPEPPPAPPEAPRQVGEPTPWPPAYRTGPVTANPANMTYTSRPLASTAARSRQAAPAPAVPAPAPQPAMQPVTQMQPLEQPPAVAAPSVIQTSSVPEARQPAPAMTRVDPTPATPVMKVGVASVPPIRLTEKELTRRISDACGKLAKEVKIEVADGNVVVHVYALPATEHLLVARLLHVHELGARNVQLHVHLAN
jgi:hypothetical protein